MIDELMDSDGFCDSNICNSKTWGYREYIQNLKGEHEMTKVIKHYDDFGNILDDYAYFYFEGDIIHEVVNLCVPPNIGDSVKIAGSVYMTKNVICDIDNRCIEYHLSR